MDKFPIWEIQKATENLQHPEQIYKTRPTEISEQIHFILLMQGIESFDLIAMETKLSQVRKYAGATFIGASV